MEPSEEFIEDRIRQLIAERGQEITRKRPRLAVGLMLSAGATVISTAILAAWALITRPFI